MQEHPKSKLRSIISAVWGSEPAPPIGEYADPPGKNDRRQLIAFFVCFAAVAVLAVAVSKFGFLDIHFRNIPPEVLDPFHPTVTPTIGQ